MDYDQPVDYEKPPGLFNIQEPVSHKRHRRALTGSCCCCCFCWMIVALIAFLALCAGVAAIVLIVVYPDIISTVDENIPRINEEVMVLREQIELQGVQLTDLLTRFPPDPPTTISTPPATTTDSPYVPSSCFEINCNNRGAATSGTYLLSNGSDIVNVTCDFDTMLPPSRPVRGWQEIISIDLSDPTVPCPSPLREVTNPPARRCERVSNDGGPVSLFFSTNGVPFFRLCGQVLGYSDNTPDAFFRHLGEPSCVSAGCDTINDPYVDGISLTYTSNNSREHIWTLVAGHNFESRCPCGNPLITPPDFVGENYYCEVRVDHTSLLWEGEGCSDVNSVNAPCCEDPDIPWFCREFDQPVVTDSIEVRLCTDQVRADEDIDLSSLKLYIQ